jgi:AcrR family transcriptional regulator
VTARRITTKEKIVDAALGTLKAEGYAGASSRAIAANGKFNQALIFYHLGGVDEALLAALDRSNELRLARYREVFAGATTLTEMIDAAAMLYREDVESGHVRVLCEMIAAGAGSAELGREVAARVEPWVAFTRETFARVTAGSALAALISADDAAYALTSLYLGMELLNNLSGSHEQADAMFAKASAFASLLAPFLLAPEGGTA